MKQLCKRTFSLTLGLLMLFSLTLPQALASDFYCGPNLEWSIDNTTLTISGTGAMDDYEPGDAPWSPLLVETVVLEEGITSLGANAFGWCEDLTNITLPASLQSIAANAISGDEGLGGQNPYLKTLVLPKQLKNVSSDAFAWSTVSVYQFKAGAPKLGKGCFEGNYATIRCPKKQKKVWTKAIKSVRSQYKKKTASVYPDLTLKAS